jgi:hypothetical protein
VYGVVIVVESACVCVAQAAAMYTGLMAHATHNLFFFSTLVSFSCSTFRELFCSVLDWNFSDNFKNIPPCLMVFSHYFGLVSFSQVWINQVLVFIGTRDFTSISMI